MPDRVSVPSAPPVVTVKWPAPSGGHHRRGDGAGVLRRVDAETADQRIGAAAAGEDVVAAVAGDDIGERVAGAVDVAGAGQRQVLDVGRQRVVEATTAPCRCPR